jgi:phosphoribosylglycinamide formyltransferase-1
MGERLRVGVLVSGNGSNLQALIDACRGGAVPAEIAVVISNVPTAFALQRARAAGIPAVVVSHSDYSSVETFETALEAALATHRVELVCLAGFLRILSPRFAGAFSGRLLNIHPALLPAFGGKGMYGERVHRAVLASGVRRSGCTVHFVTDVPDGGPIIAQASVPVEQGDTPATLAARVADQEHRLYPQVVRMFAERRLRLEGDRVQILPAVRRGSSAEAR